MKSNHEILCYIYSLLLSSHSETLLQNWIKQTGSGFISPFASPVFVLGLAVLQLPASAFSSSCSLLLSWRHQQFHRCWDVVYLPLFSALNGTLQHACWWVAPQSWSSSIGDTWTACSSMWSQSMTPAFPHEGSMVPPVAELTRQFSQREWAETDCSHHFNIR